MRVVRVKMSYAGFVLAVVSLTLGTSAGSQSTSANVSRTVEGRVQLAEAKGPVVVPGTWVVLHRVGTDQSAPLDSMRASGEGHFRFRYTPFGSEDAIYFVSTTFRGIAYFSSPLRNPVVQGGDADLLVYDTTTSTSKLGVAGRHVVVSAPRNGRREVAEIDR